MSPGSSSCPMTTRSAACASLAITSLGKPVEDRHSTPRGAGLANARNFSPSRCNWTKTLSWSQWPPIGSVAALEVAVLSLHSGQPATPISNALNCDASSTATPIRAFIASPKSTATMIVAKVTRCSCGSRIGRVAERRIDPDQERRTARQSLGCVGGSKRCRESFCADVYGYLRQTGKRPAAASNRHPIIEQDLQRPPHRDPSDDQH